MDMDFFESPVINSPYEMPKQHWELDGANMPTNVLMAGRRSADFITPIPKARRRNKKADSSSDEIEQQAMDISGTARLSEGGQEYDHTSRIGQVRNAVDNWRELPRSQWQVTPETARLLEYWRSDAFSVIRPFFCQVEAVETLIWMTEVAPNHRVGRNLLNHIRDANNDANPGLNRLAFKLATGSGKTTIMAMLMAWQTVNAIRHPQSDKFTNGFLIVTPGITIRDRLRVLKPNDPDSYFRTRELIPSEFFPDIQKARIVITNYHAFKLKETVAVARGTRRLLQGANGDEFQSLETPGKMVKRVMPELMGLKRIIVINDEAHHCYIDRDPDPDASATDDKEDAARNNEAARLWINGIKAVSSKIRVAKVIDLSATPFFLNGSGYAEGTIFPWTMSDFSLMDAIECGVVKLPRVPISDNIPTNDMPMYRNLWDHIGAAMPRKGRRKGAVSDPLKLPMPLQTALEALYGHYKNTFQSWRSRGTAVPPCMIIVCNNTATSKLVYDYVSGYVQQNEDGTESFTAGRLDLFSNFDEYGQRLATPNTLLIDSYQLESGDSLTPDFRHVAADEIERFRRELRERGDHVAAEAVTDQDILREVMNTVGKEGKLGAQVRCVVSVSMLTEGWDASNVAYIMGVRAFGTQLLCEQVVGRALRRQSYEVDPESGLLDVEYADVFGIPFDFTAAPTVVTPQPPKEHIHVRAMSPARDHLEIHFPRVAGYRIELPKDRLYAEFNADSTLHLTPELVGATEIESQGIIGEATEFTLQHLKEERRSAVVFRLAVYILYEKWRDPNGDPKTYLFPDLKRITGDWLNDHLVCSGGTYEAQLMHKALADLAADRITAAITSTMSATRSIRAIVDPYNPGGSTRYVSFNVSRKDNDWQTDERKSHINWAICDSGWETAFCRVVERHPRVISYVKNRNMGFDVPYRFEGEQRKYIPDFILNVDRGRLAPLNLIVEIKGFRGEDAKDKKTTMDTYWIPGVNNLGTYGEWAFAELTDVWTLESDLEDAINRDLDDIIDKIVLK